MKLFRRFGKYKQWLLFSAVLNVLLVSAFCVLESKRHPVEHFLQSHGIIDAPELSDKDLPDYYACIGWANTIAKLHRDFDVAFLGNSITFQSDFQSVFPQISIINLGYPGDNLKGMKRRITMLENPSFKKIFIMAGTNDLIVNDVETYRADYIQLIETIKARLPQTKIYLQSVLPSNHGFNTKFDYAPNEKVRQANKMVEVIADSLDCDYINLFDLYVGNDGELPAEFTTDGVHLTQNAYKIWIEAVTPILCE